MKNETQNAPSVFYTLASFITLMENKSIQFMVLLCLVTDMTSFPLWNQSLVLIKRCIIHPNDVVSTYFKKVRSHFNQFDGMYGRASALLLLLAPYTKDKNMHHVYYINKNSVIISWRHTLNIRIIAYYFFVDVDIQSTDVSSRNI